MYPSIKITLVAFKTSLDSFLVFFSEYDFCFPMQFSSPSSTLVIYLVLLLVANLETWNDSTLQNVHGNLMLSQSHKIWVSKWLWSSLLITISSHAWYHALSDSQKIQLTLEVSQYPKVHSRNSKVAKVESDHFHKSKKMDRETCRIPDIPGFITHSAWMILNGLRMGT